MCMKRIYFAKILLLLQRVAKGADLRSQAYTALHRERQAINRDRKQKKTVGNPGLPTVVDHFHQRRGLTTSRF